MPKTEKVTELVGEHGRDVHPRLCVEGQHDARSFGSVHALRAGIPGLIPDAPSVVMLFSSLTTNTGTVAAIEPCAEHEEAATFHGYPTEIARIECAKLLSSIPPTT